MCAETRDQNKFEHSDNERSFVGTWTTDEVNTAIEKGYKVLRTYEVWHFDKTTDDLFKGYIRRFMKIKLESSKYDFKTKEERGRGKLQIQYQEELRHRRRKVRIQCWLKKHQQTMP